MHKMQQNTFGGRAPPPSRKGRQRRGGTAGEGRVLTYKGKVGSGKGLLVRGEREGETAYFQTPPTAIPRRLWRLDPLTSCSMDH